MTDRPIRRFTELLGLLDRGQFEEACDRALADALGALEALPKEKGTATLTIELQVAYDSGRIDVQPKLKSKLPDDKAFGRTPFWAYEGAFSTQHPSQMDIFAREVAPAPAKSKA